MLQSICKFIQSEDRNSDIMDAYQEMLDGELDKDTLILILQRILGEWEEDLAPLNKRIQGYFKYLGI